MVSYLIEHKIYVAISIIAMLCIATFFTSTVIVELFGREEMIVKVKGLILMPGLFILIPAMAATGGTGFSLSKTKKSPLVDSKEKQSD
jgi:asparagine N-glycosylation enzyme membrane subunit Stt3